MESRARGRRSGSEHSSWLHSMDARSFRWPADLLRREEAQVLFVSVGAKLVSTAAARSTSSWIAAKRVDVSADSSRHQWCLAEPVHRSA